MLPQGQRIHNGRCVTAINPGEAVYASHVMLSVKIGAFTGCRIAHWVTIMAVSQNIMLPTGWL